MLPLVPIYLLHVYKMSNNRMNFFLLPVCRIRKSYASHNKSVSCPLLLSFGLMLIIPAIKSSRNTDFLIFFFFCDVDICPLDAALSPPAYSSYCHPA